MVASSTKRSGARKASHPAGTPEPVRELFKEARTRAGELTDSIRRTSQSFAEEASRKASQFSRVVKEGADELVSEQKERAAARVERLGAAIGQAARVLRAGRVDKAADYVEAAAGGVEGTARYLRDSDLSVILDDVADLARQYPLVFLGAMFAAGIGVARFVKAGEPDEPSRASRKPSGSHASVRRSAGAKRRPGASRGGQRHAKSGK